MSLEQGLFALALLIFFVQDNSLSLGDALHIVGHLSGSLTSTHQMPVALIPIAVTPTMPPDITICPLGSKITPG